MQFTQIGLVNFIEDKIFKTITPLCRSGVMLCDVAPCEIYDVTVNKLHKES